MLYYSDIIANTVASWTEPLEYSRSIPCVLLHKSFYGGGVLCKKIKPIVESQEFHID